MQTRDGNDEVIVGAGNMVWTGSMWVPVSTQNRLPVDAAVSSTVDVSDRADRQLGKVALSGQLPSFTAVVPVSGVAAKEGVIYDLQGSRQLSFVSNDSQVERMYVALPGVVSDKFDESPIGSFPVGWTPGPDSEEGFSVEYDPEYGIHLRTHLTGTTRHQYIVIDNVPPVAPSGYIAAQMDLRFISTARANPALIFSAI